MTEWLGKGLWETEAFVTSLPNSRGLRDTLVAPSTVFLLFSLLTWVEDDGTLWGEMEGEFELDLSCTESCLNASVT